jgi:hypothetical protein
MELESSLDPRLGKAFHQSWRGTLATAGSCCSLGVVDPLEPVQPIKSSALLVVAEPWARLVMKDTFLNMVSAYTGASEGDRPHEAEAVIRGDGLNIKRHQLAVVDLLVLLLGARDVKSIMALPMSLQTCYLKTLKAP